MPYRWTEADGKVELSLWPHRSLSRRGFVAFIVVTSAMFLIPLLHLLGTAALWFMLAFIALTLWGVWTAIGRSWETGKLSESLTLSEDRVCLRRMEPDGRLRVWEANPYWVEVRLVRTGGPVEDYLTLRGNGREVEIGAFLSPEERRNLRHELEARLKPGP